MHKPSQQVWQILQLRILKADENRAPGIHHPRAAATRNTDKSLCLLKNNDKHRMNL